MQNRMTDSPEHMANPPLEMLITKRREKILDVYAQERERTAMIWGVVFGMVATLLVAVPFTAIVF